ncbi:MAG: heavy metal-associated domain-containing protein, partial [Desulfobacterales bacterium]|nr:heavy metal-associated domain-containing protein [Desulfobacterales bacterium]
MESVKVQNVADCSCGEVCALASRRVFRVAGMDCPHETGPIITALSGLPGVGKVVPSFADATLTVEFEPHAVTAERIVQTIGEAGFRANAEDRQQDEVPFLERYGRLV